MIISNVQKHAFVVKSYEHFFNQLVDFITKEFPEEVYGKSVIDVKNRVWNCIIKGRSFGFSREQEIAKFVFYCFEFGDDFNERFQSINAILNQEDMTSKEKIDLIGEIIYSY